MSKGCRSAPNRQPLASIARARQSAWFCPSPRPPESWPQPGRQRWSLREVSSRAFLWMCARGVAAAVHARAAIHTVRPGTMSDRAPETSVLPTFYIPHGGGPCFFMDWTMGPADTWAKMAEWLRHLGDSLASRPKAVLVVSAHWEEVRFTLTGNSKP